MKVIPVHTRPILPPQDDILPVLSDALTPLLHDGNVVAVSSKIVAIWQGRTVPIPANNDPLIEKDRLAEQEADLFLRRGEGTDSFRMHTIMHGILIGSAGIDQSNGNGHFVLWPNDPQGAAHVLREYLMTCINVQSLGVIITDSHSAPFRNGVTGLAIGYAGFNALYDYRGRKDVFSRKLKAERLNIADSLATAANLTMGEGDESTPLAVIEDIPHISFTMTESDDPYLRLVVPLEQDIFSCFYRNAPWRRSTDI